MLQYIRDHYTALYLTDANGNATQHDLLDADAVSLLTGAAVTFLPPNTFATNQWSLSTGTNPAEIVIQVSVLPAANGNPITAIQYRVGTGAWVNLSGTSTGPYTVAMAAAGAAYDISLRAVNAVGPAAQSAAKTVTSGAAAATAPATFGPSQWSLVTGTDPASLTLNVLSLPADGGSAITAIEYRVGNGSWVAFADANTGPRTIVMDLASTTYSITIRAVNAIGAGSASAAKSATSAAPATQAPAVLTTPTISGNTTVGSILTRTAGTASGTPTPSLAIRWLRNGTIISGQTGTTLGTSSFAAADVITTEDVWTNTINGAAQTATGTSDPWTLTVQPAVTATVTPLVQGELATITFNVLPDSVSVTQAGQNLPAPRMGFTNDYTFTPTTTEDVVISAPKSGYTTFTATLTVQPKASLSVNATYNVFQISNPTTSPAAMPFTAPAAYAETENLSTATASTGPEPIDVIALEVVEGGTADAGKTLSLDLRKWATRDPGSFTVDLREFRSGYVDAANPGTLLSSGSRTYAIQTADQGDGITGHWQVSDAYGTHSGMTAAVTVSAALPLAVMNATDGGYTGTTATMDAATARITVDNTDNDTIFAGWWLCQWMVKATGMTGKTLHVTRTANGKNALEGNAAGWQGAWAYDPDGEWFPFDGVDVTGGAAVLTKTAALTQDTVYIAAKPQFTNGRWVKAVNRWKANGLTSPTASGDANFVVGTLPAATGAPAMPLYGFKFGTGPDVIVITGQVHPEEHSAGYAYEAFVDWLLGNSTEAVRLRANCTFYCYPRSNPQGQYYGGSRTEITTKANANRIFEASNTTPLSQLYRQVFTADLPNVVTIPIDFHDVPTEVGGAYLYADPTSNPLAVKLDELHLARTGVNINVDRLSATAPTGTLNGYIVGAHHGRYRISPEHRMGTSYGPSEWAAWGQDIGAALAAIYPDVLPAGSPDDWVPIAEADLIFASGQTRTTDVLGDYVIRAETDTTPNPKAAFQLPVGQTYEVIVDAGILAGSGVLFFRQSSVSTLASASSVISTTIASGTGSSKDGYYRVVVTPTAQNPYFGVIHGPNSYPGEIWVGKGLRYRVVA